MRRLIFLLVFVHSVTAQTYMDVYRKIGDKYLDAKSFRVELNVKVRYVEGYESGNTSFTGVVAKRNKDMFTQLDGRVNISSSGKNLFIDRDTRTILISPSNYNEKEIRKNLFSGFEEEAYLKEYDFKFSGQNNGILVFQITPLKNTGVYSEILLEVHTDYSFSRILYTMNAAEGNTVSSIEITYTRNEFDVDIDPSLFAPEQYVVHAKGTYAGAGMYSTYKVIDQEQLQKKIK